MNLHKKKTVSLALALTLALGLFLQPPAHAASAGFSDVPTDEWYYSNVTELAAAGIVSGYPDGTFRPGGSVTNGEMLKLVLLAAGYTERSATSAHWASGYASLATSTGMLSSSEISSLDAPATRLTVARLAAQALGLAQSAEETPFADITNGWATALYEKSILTGNTDSGQRLLLPSSDIKRSEISAIVWRVRYYVAHRAAQTFSYSGRTVELLAGVPALSYDTAAFTTDQNGVTSYSGSGVTVRRGIDVSQFQGDVDWAKVKAAGIDYVILRVGGRYLGVNSSGGIYDDTKFAQNIKGATAAGLDIGVYFFSTAVSVEEAKAEADYVLSKVKGYTLKMPVVFDWETESSKYRNYDLDGAILTHCAQVFCSRVQAAGYSPMVYLGQKTAYLRYDLRALVDYPFWYAEYHTDNRNVPNFRYDFAMWQYSDHGTVDGISGNVDMDLQFIKN